MDQQHISKIIFFRRASEIGGIFFGIGMGSLLVLKLVTNIALIKLVGLVALVIGYVILVFEQKKFTIFKKSQAGK